VFFLSSSKAFDEDACIGIQGNAGVSHAAQSRLLESNKKSRAASMETARARPHMRRGV